MTDSILDPTVEKFYKNVIAKLDSLNAWENGIKEVFDAIAPALPIPSDIDYALTEFTQVLEAVGKAWDEICATTAECVQCGVTIDADDVELCGGADAVCPDCANDDEEDAR